MRMLHGRVQCVIDEAMCSDTEQVRLFKVKMALTFKLSVLIKTHIIMDAS